MQAGKLRKQIAIEAQASAQDAFGAPQPTWSAVHRCWARVAAVTGREVYTAGAGFSGQLTHKVTIRYTSVVITPGMRVRCGSKALTIQAPPMDVDEKHEELDLLCLEQAP